MACLILFVLLPLATTIWVAFFSNKILSFPPEGYTAAWFVQAWNLVDFRNGFILSLEVAVSASVLALCLGVPAALAIGRYQFRGRELINTVLMSPLMIPAIVSGSAIYLFYIDVQIWSDIQLASTFYGLTLAHTLIAIPWVLRLLVASLAGLNPAIEEASLSLGASRLVTFFRITLPVIRPGITAGALFGIHRLVRRSREVPFARGSWPHHLTDRDDQLSRIPDRSDNHGRCHHPNLVIATALFTSDRYVRLGRTF